MKVLWVSNIIFPEVCNELHMTPPVVGGWMYASALALLENNPHLDLAVASLYSGKELKIVTNYKIQYYLIPQMKLHVHRKAVYIPIPFIYILLLLYIAK